MALFRRELLDWRKVRVRIIRETNDYLTACLRDPKLGTRIPAVPADQARWTREFAQAFWSSVL